MAAALFTRIDDDVVEAGPLARGPWSPDSLHGGPVAALLGGVAEPLLEDLHPARVTVELLRPVPVGVPLRAAASVSRPGRKVRLVGSEIRTADGTLVASATVLGIRRADLEVPHQEPVPAPPGPDTVAPALRATVSSAGAGDYEAFHNVGVEHRFVRGSFEEPGPATDWIRLAVPVLDGEDPSPLQRVLAAADFGNGVSRIVDFAKLLFINPDLTVHLHRLPTGEWVCLDAVTRLEAHGVGLAQSALWDEQGLLGRSQQSLLVDART
jgi:hypothetical protein